MALLPLQALASEGVDAQVAQVPVEALSRLPAGVEDRVSDKRPVVRSRYARIDVKAFKSLTDTARRTGGVVDVPLFPDISVGFTTDYRIRQTPDDVGGADAWVGRIEGRGDDVAVAIVVTMPDGSLIARFTAGGRSFAIDQLVGPYAR